MLFVSSFCRLHRPCWLNTSKRNQIVAGSRTAVGTNSGVSHGEQEGHVVLQVKVLVLEFGAIDRLASCSVLVREVASLNHEIL